MKSQTHNHQTLGIEFLLQPAFICSGILLVTALGISHLPAAVISADIKATIQDRVDYAYNPGIIIGITDPDGRDIFTYGRTSYENGVTPDENTLFEIGSVTKIFTTTLLAEMANRGELLLTDPVESFLPENVSVPKRGRIFITFHHLATHASGLPRDPPSVINNDPVNPFFPFPAEELYSFLNGYILPRSPGTTFEYSNLGMGLLGHALTLKLGVSYQVALQERILTPLGMTDTVITPTPEQLLRRAEGYTGVVPRPPFKMQTLGAAGALLSTVGDRLTFLEHQTGLRTSSISSVIQDTHQVQFSRGAPGQDLGLGWFIIPLPSRQIFMHDGATLGQNSFVGFNVNTQTGVVVLTNARINAYSAVQDIGLRSLSSLIPLTRIPQPASQPIERLRSFVGRYQAENGTFFKVGLRQGHLTIQFSEDRGAEFTLYAQNSRRFQLLELGVDASATFSVDPSGKATAMNWSQGGQTTRIDRILIPPRLSLILNHGIPELGLTGETDTEYIIEVSNDLEEWSFFKTTTIWDPPITDLEQKGVRHRFFQARSNN
ncbi:MAG TPA: serine hydrolase [Verrucomicrobiales bacterium]|nr:serine hydrolase [Verrucomicrobiales bacterium]HIL70427.1 serine hydrolase [Verrucomicrobiota bacterium]